MKTDPIQGSLKQPSLFLFIFRLLIAAFALSISVKSVVVDHRYPTWYFVLDLIILICIGLEVTGYRLRTYRWKREKAMQEWRNGKDSE